MARSHRGAVLVETIAGLVLVVLVGLTLAQAMVQVVAAQRVATMTAAAGRAVSDGAPPGPAARGAAPSWLRARLVVGRTRSATGEEISVRATAPRLVPWWPDTTVTDHLMVTR